MRQLYLLRHAKSNWDDPASDDFHRPLSGRGREAAGRMAAHLAAAGVHPAEVLCSTATRARQTWEAIARALPGVPISFEEGLYLASRGDLLARLRQLDGHLPSVMVIGHNPGVERLASGLSAGHGDPVLLKRLKEKYPTGTLATLSLQVAEWSQIELGAARLEGFVRPRDLLEE